MDLLFIKLAIRNILKNRINSLINIIGLSVGIAATLLLFIFLKHETSFDNYHADAENIYRMRGGYDTEDKRGEFGYFWYPGASDMKERIPEIQDYCRVSEVRHEGDLYIDNQNYKAKYLRYADENFFQFFDYKLVEGDKETILNSAEKIVLSSTEATRLFGGKDPVGKIITYNKQPFTVSGIFKDLPSNTHLRVNALISIKHVEKNRKRYFLQYAGGLTFLSYLKLDNGVSATKIEEKISEVLHDRINKHIEKRGFTIFAHLQNIKDIHLNSSDFEYDIKGNRNKSSIYIVLSICLLILTLAVINYITIYIAQKTGDIKELKILSIHGGGRWRIAMHTFNEVFIISFLSAIVGGVLLIWALPFLNNLLQTALAIGENIIMIAGFTITAVFVLSFIITLFSTSGVFNKNTFGAIHNFSTSAKSNNISGRLMLAFQFTVVIVLIICSFIISGQNRYILNKDLGFDKESIMCLRLEQNFKSNRRDAVRNELSKISGIENVTLTSETVGAGITRNGYQFEKGQNEFRMFNILYTDAEFLKCYDVDLIVGRNFRDNISKSNNSILVNQQFVKDAGWEVVLGKKIYRGEKELEVIGVINDINFASLHEKVEPMLVMANPDFDRWEYNYVNIRYNTSDISSLMADIGDKWEVISPETPFEPFFMEDKLNENYKKLKSHQKMVSSSSMVAIIIALMGLIGLTILTTKRRIKEIGVRKVNGAKVSEILAMLNQDFIKWVFISFIIAVPVSYYMMSRWLESFAYKTEISWWVFAIAGILALTISVITVSWISWKAATRNPVEALRYE
jgi:putative ABC transport system permease protein